MDARKIALYLILISSIAAVLSQTPMIQAVGRGQHTFENGRNVDCMKCHQYDAYQDMNSSQASVLDAHKRAAKNLNYTTYLEVGGISYDPAGFINTNVDSDNNGANDTWAWNGSMWTYNNTFKLYDLDLNRNGTIEGGEICKLCHNLELMGLSNVSAAHTIGTRYCDDDRCHGNKNHVYNDYRLFADGSSLIAAGRIMSNNSVHGFLYNEAASRDANISMLHSYGSAPGNVAPGKIDNISTSPYICLGCHSYMSVTGSITPSPRFNHSYTNASRGRYT